MREKIQVSEGMHQPIVLCSWLLIQYDWLLLKLPAASTSRPGTVSQINSFSPKLLLWQHQTKDNSFPLKPFCLQTCDLYLTNGVPLAVFHPCLTTTKCSIPHTVPGFPHNPLIFTPLLPHNTGLEQSRADRNEIRNGYTGHCVYKNDTYSYLVMWAKLR